MEAERLGQRTNFDLEMLRRRARAGIENYSRYLCGRKPGERRRRSEYSRRLAAIVDSRHRAADRGMFRGDFNRKSILTRSSLCPSCIDNRPLKFEE